MKLVEIDEVKKIVRAVKLSLTAYHVYITLGYTVVIIEGIKK